MFRILTTCTAAALIVLIGAGMADAQWTDYATGDSDPHAIARGPGFYLGIWKIVLLALIFWMWVKTTDWINRDSNEIGKSIGLPPDVWNPVAVFSFLVVFIIAMLIPIFLAGYFLILIAYFVPLITYIALRNGRVTK